MKTNVAFTVIQTNEADTKDIAYSLQGRLLGACNSIDATKIAENWPVIERILTSSASTLEDSVTVMKKINKEEGEKGFGHLIIALSSLNRLENSTPLEVFTEQLFISPPITLFSEIPNKDNGKTFYISMTCADNSLITVEDYKDE